MVLSSAISLLGLCLATATGLARALPGGGTAGRSSSISSSSAVLSERDAKVEVVYQFPPTMAPENEFLRNDGQLLVTCLTCNTLSQLDPNLGPTQQRRTVYVFPDGVINVLGIDQLSPDVFAVAVGELPLASASQINSTAANLAGLVSGPTGVWVVDLRQYQAPTYDSSLVKAYPVGGSNLGALFDGVAVINGAKGLVATTDFVEGNIWLVDIAAGTTTVLVGSQLVLPPSAGKPSSLALANGLRFRDGRLYFTASATGTYASVPVDPATGKLTGPVQVLYDYGFSVDDFNFAPGTGNVYFTTFAKPDGGVLKRAGATPPGQSGTTMPVSYFATNSVIARNRGADCELIATVFLQFQVVKFTIPGPC